MYSEAVWRRCPGRLNADNLISRGETVFHIMGNNRIEAAIEVLELMGALKLYGMRSAYDEIMGVAIKRQHGPPRIAGDLLQAEILEKQTLLQCCRLGQQARDGGPRRSARTHCRSPTSAISS
jgi:hypothetical protein